MYEQMLDEAVNALVNGVSIPNNPTAGVPGLGGTVEIEKLPETEGAYKRQFTNPQVYVGYNSSQFTEQQTTAQALKDEEVVFQVSVKSRKLYGVEGVYDLIERTRRILHGTKFSNASRRTLIKEIMPAKEPSEKGSWHYLMVFSCLLPIIQYPDEILLTATPSTQIILNPPNVQ